MKPDDIRAIIERAGRAWVAGDAESFAALFTPDGEFVVPGKRWQSPPAIREVLARFAERYSDVRVDIRRIIVDGDQAAVEWYWEDTKNETGARNRADDAIVVDFRDGRISRWREYIDTKSPATNS
ncbi:MAG TPA: SgcJ/EcaC family oxidoreductase [Anaerolineae bacterium]